MNTIWEMNAWSLIKAGGPIMAPILLCSLVAMGIVIEKLIYFTLIKINVPAFKARVFDRVKNNNLKDAVKACDESPSPVAKILKAGIIKFGSSKDDMKENMEDVSLFEIPKLEERLNALATIAHVSPLLGLLGTVTGMTASTKAISSDGNPSSQISSVSIIELANQMSCTPKRRATLHPENDLPLFPNQEQR